MSFFQIFSGFFVEYPAFPFSSHSVCTPYALPMETKNHIRRSSPGTEITGKQHKG